MPDGDAVEVTADVGGDPERSAIEPVPVPGDDVVLDVVTVSILADGLASVSAPGAVTVWVPAGPVTGAEVVSVEAVEEIVAVDDVSVALEVSVLGLLMSDGAPFDGLPVVTVFAGAGAGAGVPPAVVPTVSAGALGAGAAAAAGSVAGSVAGLGLALGAGAVAVAVAVAVVGGAGDEAMVEAAGGAIVDAAGAGAVVATGAGSVAGAVGVEETGAEAGETVFEGAGGEIVEAAGAAAGAACAGAAAGAACAGAEAVAAGAGAAAVAACAGAAAAAGVGSAFGPRAGVSVGVGFSAFAGFEAEALLQVEVVVRGVDAAELPAAGVALRAAGEFPAVPVEPRGATAGGAGGTPTVGVATGSVGMGAVS